jgi:hypothetical protein
VLVRGGGGPVFFKLNDRLETESGGGDLWLEDSDKIDGDGFDEVNDDWLWSNGGVCLLTNSFGEGEAGETLF